MRGKVVRGREWSGKFIGWMERRIVKCGDEMCVALDLGE